MFLIKKRENFPRMNSFVFSNDILFEIFLCLYPFQLYKCACVSSSWRKIVKQMFSNRRYWIEWNLSHHHSFDDRIILLLMEYRLRKKYKNINCYRNGESKLNVETIHKNDFLSLSHGGGYKNFGENCEIGKILELGKKDPFYPTIWYSVANEKTRFTRLKGNEYGSTVSTKLFHSGYETTILHTASDYWICIAAQKQDQLKIIYLISRMPIGDKKAIQLESIKNFIPYCDCFFVNEFFLYQYDIFKGSIKTFERIDSKWEHLCSLNLKYYPTYGSEYKFIQAFDMVYFYQWYSYKGDLSIYLITPDGRIERTSRCFDLGFLSINLTKSNLYILFQNNNGKVFGCDEKRFFNCIIENRVGFWDMQSQMDTFIITEICKSNPSYFLTDSGYVRVDLDTHRVTFCDY